MRIVVGNNPFYYWGYGPVGPGFLMRIGRTRFTSSGGGIPFDKLEKDDDCLDDEEDRLKCLKREKKKRTSEITALLMLIGE